MKQVFDVLSRHGFNSTNTLRQLTKFNESRLSEFVISAAEAVRETHVSSAAPRAFSFAASGALSGEPHPCQALGCRLKRVDSVARFAALYGDEVLIGDPFEHAVLSGSSGAHVIADLVAAVETMFMLRPAIDAGLVRFVSRRLVFCKQCDALCYRKRSKVEKHLLAAMTDKVSATLTRDPHNKYLVLSVLDAFGWIDHGELHYHGVEVRPSLKKKLGRKSQYKLTTTEFRNLWQIKHLAMTVSYDIAVQESFANRGYSYLTERDIDFEAISRFEDSKSNDKRKAMLSGLQHALPALTTVPLAKLVRLRKSEGEAFAVYRDNLLMVINDLNSENTLTVNRVKQAVSDCVQPEINRINRTIRENRRALWTSLKEDILFGALIASCGLYAGYISPTCAAVGAALGGVGLATRSLKTANKLCKEPDDVRKSDFYFLWKAMN
jgi:hypothetical protein